jgi:hypothetical protein
MTIQSGIDVAIPSRLISQTIDSLCYEIILKPEVRQKRNETLQVSKKYSLFRSTMLHVDNRYKY